MHKIKKQILLSFIGVWAIATILFIVFSGFGSVPMPGKLTLEINNSKEDVSVTFTKWRFAHYEYDGKLQKLKFTAHVRPEYYVLPEDKIHKRYTEALSNTKGQRIVIEVFDAKKIDKNMYVAKAQIEVNSTILPGRFLYRASQSEEFTFEGRFEVESNWLTPERMKNDINFALKAFMPSKR